MYHHRVAIIKTAHHENVTQGLLDGARKALEAHKVPVTSDDIFSAPGTFEVPLLAQALARSGRYDAVVCVGCVIKGETAHFEQVNQAAVSGLMQAMLSTGVPITWGVLTCYTQGQALARSGDDEQNKGREAAMAAMEAVQAHRRIGTVDGT